MSQPSVSCYFDFVDPLSFLLSRALETLIEEGAEGAIPIVWSPFELRPPPAELVLVEDPAFTGRWAHARDAGRELGLDLRPPRLMPSSRKAHELHLHAISKGVGPTVRDSIFGAYLLEAKDIGRVDVLVQIAVGAGLDATETKAVLDVDRFQQDVSEARQAAIGEGITAPPTLVRGTARLEGFHKGTTVGTFLRGS